MPDLLEVKAIDAFYGDFQALFGVSLRVEAGQIIAVIGANGAGKSTLLKTIAGLMRPHQGEILFEGVPVTGTPAFDVVSRGIALVPEGRRLFPSLTVEENLLIGGQSHRPGPWTIARIYELFPMLAERRHLPAPALSGGQQQMAAIGRALMANPQLLLCDEISLGLVTPRCRTWSLISSCSISWAGRADFQKSSHLEPLHRGHVLACPLAFLTLGRKYLILASAIGLLALVAADYPSRVSIWKFFLIGILASEVAGSAAFAKLSQSYAWIMTAVLRGVALLIYDFGGMRHDWVSRLGLTTAHGEGNTVGLGLACFLILWFRFAVPRLSAILNVLPLRLLGVVMASMVYDFFYIYANFPELGSFTRQLRPCFSILNRCRRCLPGIFRSFSSRASSSGR